MIMLMRYLPYAALVFALSTGYVMWTNMKAEIASLKTEVVHKQIAIDTLADNLIEADREAESDRKRAVSEVLAQDLKKRIEDSMNRDKSSSVDINSTRFYL